MTVAFSIIYAALVFQPIIIFSSLYGGTFGGVGGIPLASLITLLLFSEIGSLLGREPMSKEEILTAYIGIGTVTGFTGLFIYAIQLAYLRRSPEISISSQLPTWLVPSINSPGIVKRLLIYPDWVPFIVIHVFAFVLWYIANYSLGVLSGIYCTEIEKLPFPIQEVEASLISTLTTRESKKMRYFMLYWVLGLFYGLITFVWPIITFITTKSTGLSIVPIPWVDMDSTVNMFIKGAIFVVPTDLMALATGFVVDFKIVIIMFLGSCLIGLIGNPLAYKFGLLPNVFPGASFQVLWLRSYLDFWITPLIGLTIGIAVIPFITSYKDIFRLFDVMKALRKENLGRKLYSPWLLLALYFFSSLGTVILAVLLDPSFIQWTWVLLILCLIYPFIFVWISVRAMAATGFVLSIPYVFELTMIALPYSKPDMWFVPTYTPHTIFMGSPSPEWGRNVFLAKSLDVDLLDLTKAWFFALPVAWFFSLIYTQAFWSLAQIPSLFYPNTMISWPIWAEVTDAFVSKRIVSTVKVSYIALGLVVAIFVYFLELLTKIRGLSLAIVMGLSSPGSLITTFFGAMLGKYVMPKIHKDWETYKTDVVAGLATGEGIMIGIAALLAVLTSSVLNLPY
jgi:hypothetical protein